MYGKLWRAEPVGVWYPLEDSAQKIDPLSADQAGCKGHKVEEEIMELQNKKERIKTSECR